MVSQEDILASNARIDEATCPRVAVFMGSTSGIGKATLSALVHVGVGVKIYVIGRASAEGQMAALFSDLKAVNTKAEFVWLEANVSLLAETHRVCGIIRSSESYLDLLFLNAGFAPLSGRRLTEEGLELSQSLEYYSRMLFIIRLLPLLKTGRSPRIISVLAGGFETTDIDVDDPELKEPGNFSFIKGRLQYVAMNTVTLEKLADENPEVTFVHSSPGQVKTGNIRKSFDPDSIMAWIARWILEPILGLFSMTEETAGQRHLFKCTSAMLGGQGVIWNRQPGLNTRGGMENGLFLVSGTCDSTPNEKTVAHLRAYARDKIWSHTQELLQAYL